MAPKLIKSCPEPSLPEGCKLSLEIDFHIFIPITQYIDRYHAHVYVEGIRNVIKPPMVGKLIFEMGKSIILHGRGSKEMLYMFIIIELDF